MKKIIRLFLLVLMMGAFSTIHAQDSSAVKKAATGVKKAAKKVGNKTAEITVKGKAAVVDKKYKDMEGPDGQTIYIDRHSKYYWVDKTGHNVYVKKSQLKPKPKE